MTRRSATGLAQRSGDARRRHDLFRRLIGWVFAQWEPIAGGRLLLLASGALTTVTAPLLGPDLRTWKVLAAVTAVMTVVLLASFALPWSRLPRSATAAFPILVWLAVAALGLGAHGLGAYFTGLFFLCFAYLGLTQQTRTIVTLAPVAAACYVGAYDGWTRPLTARLLIAVLTWLLLAVLIAELVDRQLVLVGKLRLIARTDVLTGLPNRRDLDHHMTRAAPGDTVMILDLDHFKALNDTQGHAAGDLVLAEFGLLLRTGLRHDDYAARYGGEEFALILRGADPAQASAVLQRLRRHWAVLQPELTFSSGTATCRRGRRPEHTLAAADQALYQAKPRDATETSPRNQPPPPSMSRGAHRRPTAHHERGTNRSNPTTPTLTAVTSVQARTE